MLAVLLAVAVCFLQCNHPPAEQHSTGNTSEIDSLLAYAKLSRSTHPDSSRNAAAHALELSASTGYGRGNVLSLIELSQLEDQDQHYTEAYALLKNAEKEALLVNDSLLAAKCYIHIGQVYKNQQNYDSAFSYLFRSLAILENAHHTEYLAEAKYTIGILFDKTALYDSAIVYGRASTNLYRQLHDSVNLAQGLCNLGSCYYMRSDTDYTLANLYLDSALVIAQKINAPQVLISIYNNKAAVEDVLGNTVESIRLFKENGQLLEQRNHQRLKVQNLSNIGISYHNIQEWDSAIHYLHQGISQSFLYNYTDLIPYQYYYLGNAYHGKDKNLDAILYYKKAYQYNDTLAIVEAKKTALDLLKKYETEKKEQHIALQNEEIKNKGLKNKLLWALLTVMLLIVSGIVVYVINYRKMQNTRLALQKQELQELLSKQEINILSAMMEGQDQERKRIAEDLHDRLGSVLATVKMHFSSFQDSLPLMDTKPQLEKVDFLLDEAVREVRNVSYNLSTGVLQKFGLLEGLNDLCKRITATQMLQVNIAASGSELKLQSTAEIAIYRVMQEVMGNIMKHAAASEVNIHINRTNDLLTILIEDNGVGFDLKKSGTGMGLKNMRSRMHKLGGEITIDTNLGAGTTIILEIPTYGTTL